MRIILKTGGVVVLVGALSTLVALVALRGGKANPINTFSNIRSSSASAPIGSIALLENGNFSEPLDALWHVKQGVPTLIKKAGPGGASQYIHLQVVPDKSNPYAVNLGQHLAKSLKTGDQVVFHGWFRSPESLTLHFYVEETEGIRAKTVSKQLYLTPEWSEQSVIGTINRDFASGEAQLMIHFGVTPGSVDIANLRLNNYGPVAPSDSPSASPSAKTAKTGTP